MISSENMATIGNFEWPALLDGAQPLFDHIRDGTWMSAPREGTAVASAINGRSRLS